MRWVVHIGAPKTGSTAIQRFLFDNQHSLLAQGVLYPAVSLRGYGHHDLAFLLAGGYPHWATPQTLPLADLTRALQASLAAHAAATVVLSSENFFLYPEPADLLEVLRSAGLRSEDDVSVVCYVRRQDEAHSSWYNQTVKAQGNALSFAATVERDRDLWDYARRLEPWREVFGAASILIRDYAPFASGRDDVRADFLDVLGLSCSGFDLPPGRVNERINRDILALQRLANRLPMPTAWKRRYHRQLIALTAHAAPLAVFDDSDFLTPAERGVLVASYAASNASVARTYLGRDSLFDPVAPASPGKGRRPRQGLTLAKAVFTLKWLCSGMPS